MGSCVIFCTITTTTTTATTTTTTTTTTTITLLLLLLKNFYMQDSSRSNFQSDHQNISFGGYEKHSRSLLIVKGGNCLTLFKFYNNIQHHIGSK